MVSKLSLIDNCYEKRSSAKVAHMNWYFKTQEEQQTESQSFRIGTESNCSETDTLDKNGGIKTFHHKISSRQPHRLLKSNHHTLSKAIEQ